MKCQRLKLVFCCMFILKIRSDYCDENSASPSKDLQLIMDATVRHPWQTAYDEGKLSFLPTPLMMIGNLEGRKRHSSLLF